MHVTADTLDLKPPRPGRWGTPVVLALVAHALLMAALTWGIHWKADEPEAAFEAELWSALPREAAPRAVEPPPPPPPEPEPQPKPEPRPEPKPEPKPAPPPPQPTVKAPDIATEKAKQKKLEDEKRRELEEERKKEKAKKEKAEQAEREKKEKLKEKELAEKKKAEDVKKVADQKKQDLARKEADKREAAEADKRRKENLARMMGQVNGSGGQGKDDKSSGPNGAPSSGYASKVAAKIRPNIRYSEEFPRSLRTEVEVRTLPDGTITSRRVVDSSGNPAWDDAALKAIDRTGSLPRDIDGRVPTPQIIVVRPTD